MKNTTEWLQGFNLLWNNIASDKAPGLEPYEISVFLTQAQASLVKDVFSPKSNTLSEGFDDSAGRQSDFKTLIETENLGVALTSEVSGVPVMSDRRRYFKCPQDMLVILNEELNATSVQGKDIFYTIVPVSHEEYARLMMRPYKYPPKGQAWRLILHTGQKATSSDDFYTPEYSYQIFELIANFASLSNINYRIRYVKRPSPIILESLSGTGLSIEGQTAEMTCQLPEHLHDEILSRAVALAKISWIEPTSQER